MLPLATRARPARTSIGSLMVRYLGRSAAIAAQNSSRHVGCGSSSVCAKRRSGRSPGRNPAALSDLSPIHKAPLPNPRWVRWDHADSTVWPAIDFLDGRDQSVVPAYVVDTAARARGRILAVGLPCVLGHADFEAQNLRWHGRDVWTVHDWDSLAWQPEAALVGAASGAFASAGPPTLAPIDSSDAFLTAYQDRRGRVFTAAEREVAWAASLWPAAHNARWETLHGDAPVSGDALREQAAGRLRRARA